MKKRFFAIIIFIILLTSILFSCQYGETYPKAAGGTLDLSGWDFEQKGAVNLDGEWEFYWGELLEPGDFAEKTGKGSVMDLPGSWNGYIVNGKPLGSHGYATLRLNVNFPDSGSLKALIIPTIYTSYKMWINGELLCSQGVVGTNLEETEPKYYERAVNIRHQKGPVEIVLQVSNFDNKKGGVWKSIIFGDGEQIHRMSEIRILFDVAVFGSLFVVGIEYMMLYLLRRKDKYNFYFSGFCLSSAIRSMFTGEVLILRFFPSIPQEFVNKIQYMALYLVITFFILFISSLFPKEASGKVCRTVCIVSIGYLVVTIISPVRVYSHLLAGFRLVMAATCLYIIYVLIKAVRRKKEGALMTAIGALVFIAAVFNDIFYSMEMIDTFNMAPFGLLGFVFFQSYILSRRYANAFENVENMTQRLIQADRVKDDFLADISQQLLAPLNGITGITESVIDGDYGEMNCEQKQELSLLLSIGRRISILVRDILDFSKLKNNDIELNKKLVSIKPLAQAVLEICRHLVAHKEVIMENEIPEIMPLVEADENRLMQIIYNLVSNAIRYTSQGSIAISGSICGNFIKISVAGTGADLSNETYDDIFRPYKLPEGNNPYEYGETGLGLSIAKKLVELHGGSISAEPGKTGGTVFSFTLPVAEAHHSQVDDEIQNKVIDLKSPESKTNLGNTAKNTFKILIVDDEPVNIHVLYNYLIKEGYSVVTASNGVEAIRMINMERDIDLVILDIAMPGCTGLHVCSVIRREYSIVELPVLLLTARNQNQEIADAFEAGANDYIIKPFNKTVLLSRVKTHLALKKAAGEIVSSEVKFLQAQIKPHFLFNTLNTIIGLCRTDSEKARGLLSELSTYLRGKYRFKSMDHFISVREEMELVEAYLKIEMVRYDERLKVEYKNNANQNFKVPPLILQPIVENAVRHGIYPRKEGGTVSISIKEKNDSIDFIVKDDGMGMDDEKVIDILNGKFKSEGIGIQNVDRRLRNYYGRGLLIESRPGVGTKVTMSIPKTKESS